MKKPVHFRILFFALGFLAIAHSLYANVAMPQMIPAASGDVHIDGNGFQNLRIEKEILELNLGATPGSYSRAIYFIRNTGTAPLESKLWFVTPYMDRVTVTVNGKPAAAQKETVSPDQLDFQVSSYPGSPKSDVDVYSFYAAFSPDAVTQIDIEFFLPAGYDNTGENAMIDSAVAAHFLNWFKEGGSVKWYQYNLSAATTFAGGIALLEITVKIPDDMILDINIPLQQTGWENEEIVYSGVFSGIPVPTINAFVTKKVEYNFIGATFGIGLHTNFGPDTQFLTQALLDIYFMGHQLSAGIEANPFGNCFKIPVLYTWFPGGRMPASFMSFADIRFSGGILLDRLPESITGIRIAAGMRITIMVIELSYDFYPFDADAGYIWRMMFLYKVSI
ncbi:MAG: hypothetical protein JW904_10420 [Spirochaetales bacterium]|nr:hypothetical protein [Spirochaetales bacterium]